MATIKRATTWYKFTPDNYGGHFEYNHLADGWQDATAPIAVTWQQTKAWAGKRWRKKHGFVKDGVVIEI